jgi:hypothetical protein
MINCRIRKSNATKPKPKPLISWRLSDHERCKVGLYPENPTKPTPKRPERKQKENAVNKKKR